MVFRPAERELGGMSEKGATSRHRLEEPRYPMAPSPSYMTFGSEDIEQSTGARFEQQVARSPDHLAVVTESLDRG